MLEAVYMAGPYIGVIILPRPEPYSATLCFDALVSWKKITMHRFNIL